MCSHVKFTIIDTRTRESAGASSGQDSMRQYVDHTDRYISLLSDKDRVHLKLEDMEHEGMRRDAPREKRWDRRFLLEDESILRQIPCGF